MNNQNDFFYKPKIGPDLDYLSEKTFVDEIEDISPEPSTEEAIEAIVELVKDIDKIKEILDILPEDIGRDYRDTLNKIKHDILNPPKDPIYPPSDFDIPEVDPEESIPGDQDPEDKDPNINIITIPEETDPEIPLKTVQDLIIKGTEKDPIYIFPVDNPIQLVSKEVPPLHQFVRSSFIKDKTDMYNNFVQKFKLMIQQYMREVLYIAKVGKLDSYQDLFIRYKKPAQDIPKDLMAASDRIVKNQLTRDAKTRLLNKVLNIDQTVYHLIACKSSYEQRQRYYNIDYLKANDYIDTQENDELRRLRLEYDKKYDQNMYNYYKYLTGSNLLAEEVLQTFLSEARGKALLHKNGINIKEGYEEEQAKQKHREAELKKVTEEKQKIEEGKQKKLLDELKNAGLHNSFASFNPSGGEQSGGQFNGQIVGASPVSGINAEKIVQMANQAFAKRGPSSSNPLRYSMDTEKRSYKIFDGAVYADCSYFVKGVVHYALGIDVGDSTKGQVNKNKSRQWVYSINELQPGDLIYFKKKSNDSWGGYGVTLPNGTSVQVNHTLIYLGNNEVIECTKTVGVDGLRKFNFSSGWFKTDYMETRFAGAFRL